MWQKHMYICMDRIPLESHIARMWPRAKWPSGRGQVGHYYLPGDAVGAGCRVQGAGCRVWLWVDPLVLLDLPFTSLRVFRLHSGEWSRPHTDNDVNEVPQLLPQKFSSACHVVLQNVPINVSRLQFKHPTPKLTAKKNPPSHAQQQSETQLRIGIFAQMTDCGDTLDILIAIT